MSDLVSLKCPSCGGQLILDRSSIGAECKYCGSQFLIKEAMTAQGLNNVADAVNNLADSQQSYKERYNNLLNRIKRGIKDSDWDNVIRWCSELYEMDSSDQIYTLKAWVADLQDKSCKMNAYEAECVPEINEMTCKMTKWWGGLYGSSLFFLIAFIALIAFLILGNKDSNLVEFFLPFSAFIAGLSLLIAVIFILLLRSQSKQIESLKATKPDMKRFEALKTRVLSLIGKLIK